MKEFKSCKITIKECDEQEFNFKFNINNNKFCLCVFVEFKKFLYCFNCVSNSIEIKEIYPCELINLVIKNTKSNKIYKKILCSNLFYCLTFLPYGEYEFWCEKNCNKTKKNHNKV